MTKTILVADDSKTIQTVVALAFRATGFQVVSASDGEEALRKIDERRPELVIADVAMPAKNGYELCAALRSNPATASLPVLLIGGSFEPVDERRAADCGADGHLKKPFDTQSLIDRARALTGAAVSAPEVPPSFAASLAARQQPGGEAGAAAEQAERTEAAARRAAAEAEERARQEALRAEAEEQARQEVLRAEQARIQEARAAEQARLEAIRAEAARQEAARLEAARHAEARPSPFGAPRAPAPVAVSTGARVDTADLAPPLAADAAPRSSDAGGGSWAGSPEAGDAVRIEEPELIEDVEPLDEDGSGEGGGVPTGPSLEPPLPPSERLAQSAHVDVWALADEPARGRAASTEERPGADERELADDVDRIEEVDVDEIPADEAVRQASGMTADLAAARAMATEPVVAALAAVAGPVAAAAAPAAPGLGQEELARIAREVIERVAWEVVPDLAEVIIRAELKRLLAEVEASSD